MTRVEYITALWNLHHQANLADSDCAEPWQKADQASSHCCPIEKIMQSVMTDEEYSNSMFSGELFLVATGPQL